MELSQEKKELKEKLDVNGLSKKTWKPKTINSFKSITSSKFSGAPFFLKDERWPICPCCKVPYQHLLQLNFE